MTAPGLCPQVVTITGGSTVGISAAIKAPAIAKNIATRHSVVIYRTLLGGIFMKFSLLWLFFLVVIICGY